MIRRRYQRGSIFKRGKRKPVWVWRICEDVIGRDGIARRKRRAEILGTAVEFPTRRQVEQLVTERVRKINSLDYRPASSRTFGDYVETDWLPQVFPTLKHSTKKYYKYMFGVHLNPAFANTHLQLITRNVVHQFITGKLRSGLSWSTVRGMRTLFGTVMAAAESDDLIPSNPVRKTRFPRRGPRKERAEITPEKIRKLLAALPEPSASVARLVVCTGLRIGEALALRWGDIDLESRVVRVTRNVYDGHFDEPKSQRSRRSVPLGAMSIEVLSARKPAGVNPETLVFSTDMGTPFDRHNLVNRQLKPTCKELGLTGVGWHWLRHAHATLLDAVGTPLDTVQALLGHSSSEITREVYLHSIPADAQAAVQKVEDLLIRPKLTQVVEIGKTGSSLIQ
jgi:integrase